MPRRVSRSSLAPPRFIEPMKALGVADVPESGKWHCEIKYDGFRALALLHRGTAALWSRNQKPLDYPELIPALDKLKRQSTILDGEIVALDPEGRSSFQRLQGRDLGDRPPIVFYVFDILHLDGESLLDRPIEARRRALESILRGAKPPLILSPVFDVSPVDLLAEARRQGLEGIILKRQGSFYEPGQRSGTWLKVKNVNEQEFVIGGFTPPRNSREHFGAILVGYYEGRRLLYAGKVGTGFNAKRLRSLHAEFIQRRVEDCPFANLPLPRNARYGQGMSRTAMRTVTWLRPELVAQIKFTEWTDEGLLRHPVFLSLREDKPATKVRREASRAVGGG